MTKEQIIDLFDGRECTVMPLDRISAVRTDFDVNGSLGSGATRIDLTVMVHRDDRMMTSFLYDVLGQIHQIEDDDD